MEPKVSPSQSARRKSGPAKGTRPSGRQKGTPNKRSLQLLQGLMAYNCLPAEQLARLLVSSELSPLEQLLSWERVLPFLFPKFKEIDPDSTLTIAEAAGMLGAQALRLRDALLSHGIAPDVVRQIFADLQPAPPGAP
jgi:hypothetical protein